MRVVTGANALHMTDALEPRLSLSSHSHTLEEPLNSCSRFFWSLFLHNMLESLFLSLRYYLVASSVEDKNLVLLPLLTYPWPSNPSSWHSGIFLLSSIISSVYTICYSINLAHSWTWCTLVMFLVWHDFLVFPGLVTASLSRFSFSQYHLLFKYKLLKTCRPQDTHLSLPLFPVDNLCQSPQPLQSGLGVPAACCRASVLESPFTTLWSVLNYVGSWFFWFFHCCLLSWFTFD